jgi:hypothetical protein
MRALQAQHAEMPTALAPGAAPDPGAAGIGAGAGMGAGGSAAMAGGADAMAAAAEAAMPFVRGDRKVGRNEPCPCGSGRKYKQCHGALES